MNALYAAILITLFVIAGSMDYQDAVRMAEVKSNYEVMR